VQGDAVAEVDAGVVAQLSQAADVPRADVEADVAVHRELVVGRGAVDELHAGDPQHALVVVGHLVLADLEGRVAVAIEGEVPVEDRRARDGAVSPPELDRRRGQLDLVLDVLREEVAAEDQTGAAEHQVEVAPRRHRRTTRDARRRGRVADDHL
jgi:hypothetical protein